MLRPYLLRLGWCNQSLWGLQIQGGCMNSTFQVLEAQQRWSRRGISWKAIKDEWLDHYQENSMEFEQTKKAVDLIQNKVSKLSLGPNHMHVKHVLSANPELLSQVDPEVVSTLMKKFEGLYDPHKMQVNKQIENRLRRIEAIKWIDSIDEAIVLVTSAYARGLKINRAAEVVLQHCCSSGSLDQIQNTFDVMYNKLKVPPSPAILEAFLDRTHETHKTEWIELVDSIAWNYFKSPETSKVMLRFHLTRFHHRNASKTHSETEKAVHWINCCKSENVGNSEIATIFSDSFRHYEKISNHKAIDSLVDVIDAANAKTDNVSFLLPLQIKYLLKLDYYSEASTIAYKLRSPHPEIYNCFVEYWRKKGNLDNLNRLIKTKMRPNNIRVKNEELDCIMTTALETDDFTVLQNCPSLMADLERYSRLFGYLIKGDYELVESVYKSNEEAGRSLLDTAIRLKARLRNGDYQGAVAIFREATQNRNEDIMLYNILMLHCCKKPKYAELTQLMGEMHQKAISPTITTYGIMCYFFLLNDEIAKLSQLNLLFEERLESLVPLDRQYEREIYYRFVALYYLHHKSGEKMEDILKSAMLHKFNTELLAEALSAVTNSKLLIP